MLVLPQQVAFQLVAACGALALRAVALRQQLALCLRLVLQVLLLPLLVQLLTD